MKVSIFYKIIQISISFYVLPIYSWNNWAGNQSCNPLQILYPKTVEQLCSHIKTASLSHHKIRVAGAGYSYSDCACTHGIMLNLSHLNNILAYDKNTSRVKVEAGITLKELNAQLTHYDLALCNQPAIDTITLGGAISTATHGTGHTGTLSSFVKKIELVTSNGEKISISPTNDASAFNAALVGLGALGVMYAVTLQCEPLFYVKNAEEIVELHDFIRNYKDLYQQHEFFQGIWDVKTNMVRVRYWDRCSDPYEKKCYESLAWYHINDDDTDLTIEIAFPIDKLPQVIEQLKILTEQYWAENIEIFNEVSIRFVQAEYNFSLSPAADQDVVYVNVSAPQGIRGMQFCKDFQECTAEFHGKPHWGKMHFLDYGLALHLYGQNLVNFIDVKNRLDPQGVFSNAFVNRLCES